ncbi:EamA family transporter [Methanosarcina sp. DH2]|jgi:drug/metabolite transporter (DMT)-like permease|uniref:DMT family transporter n=1 Tax=Methanosarcina sp. DH2 TaxID=2605639 RepID=UPI001E63141B|nr:DMT family transporter [Methanosarcina sp. DH2]MCC4770512.1 EamA family transporter [Methanosarcina sp. DH2]
MTAASKPHLELLMACVIYGTVGIFMEWLKDMSVGSIIFYRVLFGLSAILCYLAITGNLGQLSLKKKKKYLLLLGILYVSQMFSYYSAIRYLGASSAVLLLYTDPIYLTFLAPVLLGEKNTEKTILALFLGLAGVFYVTRPEGGFEQLAFGSNYLKGVIFGLVGGLFSSGVIISVRYLRDEYNGLTQLVWQSVISLAFLSPFAISLPGHVLVENLYTLVLFGVLITGVGAVFYIRGVAGVTAITGSILTLLEPVSCIFFDYTVLGNPVHSGMLIGSFFILAAAVVVSLDNSVFLRKLLFGEKTVLSKKVPFWKKELLRPQGK